MSTQHGCWFISFSQLRIDQPDDADPHDLRYDVIQSLVSLIVLITLDFAVSGHGIPIGSYRCAVTTANVAVFIIAFLAWKWYPGDNLNNVRLVGGFLAALTIGVSWLPSLIVSIALIIFFALCLGVVLVIFVLKRWPKDSRTKNEKRAAPVVVG